MNFELKAIRCQTIEPGLAHAVLDLPGKSANVFTNELLAELSMALDRWEAAPPEIGLIVSSAKPGIFVAGADIVAISQTLDWNQQQIIEFCRNGQSLFDRLANLPCPTVAAIAGACLGGGLEFALAFDARVASDDRKTLLGLPEVSLGLIPGWAGTVRTPRLIDLKLAIELVTIGRLISSEQSLAIGLVDAVAAPDRLPEVAVNRVKEMSRSGEYRARRTKRREPVSAVVDREGLRRLFQKAIDGNRALHPWAPTVALEHMLDSAGDDFSNACAKEAVAMSRVYGTPSNAGLLHYFFLNERGKKYGRSSTTSAPTLRNVGIVGAGTMGGDIAQVFCKDSKVLVFDIDVRRSREAIAKCSAINNASPAISASSEAELKPCGLVIESIVENVAAKRKLLMEIESHLSPAAVLATNTSVLGIDELARGLKRPQRFCGLHFCYPAKERRLVEVVSGSKTSPEVMEIVAQWVRGVGKVPLPVRDSPGFIINRLLCPMFNEVGHLLSQGCTMESIESAMRDFGFDMGPLEFMDAIGLDTLHAAGTHLIPRLPTPTEPSLLLHAMNKAGLKGRKSGRGFYLYAEDGSVQVNEKVFAVIEQYSRPPSTPLPAEDIVRRLLMVMVNQAADVLAAQIVQDRDEIDLAMLHGAGFPHHHGGLLYWARRQGIAKLAAEMERWGSVQVSRRRYRLSPALIEWAKEESKNQ